MPRPLLPEQLGIAYVDYDKVIINGLSRSLSRGVYADTTLACRSFVLQSGHHRKTLDAILTVSSRFEAVATSSLQFLQFVAQQDPHLALIMLVEDPKIHTEDLLTQYIRQKITAELDPEQTARWHGIRMSRSKGKVHLDGDDTLPVIEVLLARHRTKRLVSA